MKNTYFAFIDESIQNIWWENYYFLGILLVPSERLNDFDVAVSRYHDKIISKVRLVREQLRENKKKEKNLESLKNKFLKKETLEIKFQKISYHNKFIYKEILQTISNLSYLKYTCFYIKESDSMNYMDQTAMVLANIFCRSVTNNSSIFIVCDDISLSKTHKQEFWSMMWKEIAKHKNRLCSSDQCPNNVSIKAILQWKSHGFMWVQIVDLLTGLIWFDYKLQHTKLLDNNNAKAKQEVVQKLCSLFWVDRFWRCTIKADKWPFYFSVWPYEKKS